MSIWCVCLGAFYYTQLTSCPEIQPDNRCMYPGSCYAFTISQQLVFICYITAVGVYSAEGFYYHLPLNGKLRKWTDSELPALYMSKLRTAAKITVKGYCMSWAYKLCFYHYNHCSKRLNRKVATMQINQIYFYWFDLVGSLGEQENVKDSLITWSRKHYILHTVSPLHTHTAFNKHKMCNKPLNILLYGCNHFGIHLRTFAHWKNLPTRYDGA